MNFTMGMFLLQNAVESKLLVHNFGHSKVLLMYAVTSNVFINKYSLDKFLTQSMQYRHKVASMKHA